MLRRQGIQTNVLIILGIATLFAAFIIEEDVSAATGVFLVLAGIDIGTRRRISELEEQIAQLKATQSESRGGVAQ